MLAFCVIVSIAVLSAACQSAYKFHGETYPHPRPAPDLLLTDQNDRPFSLSTQKGKVVLIYFGTTSSLDTDPVSLALLAQVWAGLGQEQARFFQPVFVTVDAERDTSAVLARYLRGFDAAVGDDLGLGFIGLSGSPEALAAVHDAYLALDEGQGQPGATLDYSVEHSVYVVSSQGDLVERLPYGTSAADVLADVRYLIPKGARP